MKAILPSGVKFWPFRCMDAPTTSELCWVIVSAGMCAVWELPGVFAFALLDACPAACGWPGVIHEKLTAVANKRPKVTSNKRLVPTIQSVNSIWPGRNNHQRMPSSGFLMRGRDWRLDEL